MGNGKRTESHLIGGSLHVIAIRGVIWKMRGESGVVETRRILYEEPGRRLAALEQRCCTSLNLYPSSFCGVTRRETCPRILTTGLDYQEEIEATSISSPALKAWICDTWRVVFQVVRREHRRKNEQSANVPRLKGAASTCRVVFQDIWNSSSTSEGAETTKLEPRFFAMPHIVRHASTASEETHSGNLLDHDRDANHCESSDSDERHDAAVEFSRLH
jgi:hypothetical protein